MSLPQESHIYNNKKDIQIYKTKNHNKNQFIIKPKRYINIYDSAKKTMKKKVNS
jgi:hypothetical protein